MSFGLPFDYFNPTKILCGSRALERLAFELEQHEVDLPLVMCEEDASASVLKRIIAAVKGWGITLCIVDEVPEEPDDEQLDQLALLYRQNRCDGLIVVGKDAIVNTARLLVMRLVDDGDLSRFVERNRIDAMRIPMIQIPLALYADIGALPLARTRQRQVVSPYLMPNLALFDPTLLQKRTSFENVASAFFFLALCLESVAGGFGNPITDSLAFSAGKTIFDYLKSQITHPADRDDDCFLAQAQMTVGTVAAGSTPSVIGTIAEALANACECGTGILAGILLPHLLEIFARRDPICVAQLARVLQETGTACLTAKELGARAAVNSLYNLLQQFKRSADGKFPTTLAAAGFSSSSLERVKERISLKTEAMARWESIWVDELLAHALSGTPIAIATETSIAALSSKRVIN